ncbi:MAG: S49 family peptidase [Prevotellaceae bacterium]|jgi:protease-4|nr:S49 family peptidase [Prevotellaceae bacterium]
MYNLFLHEILHSKLMLKGSFLDEFELLSRRDISSIKREFPKVEFACLAKNVSLAVESNIDSGSFDKLDENSIVVVPIIGSMFKYDTWCSYGMDYFASIIEQANKSDKVAGIMLLLNTPGGSTQSVIRLEEVLRSLVKPCVAVVDGMCCSCGIYVASFADKIVALNRMCEIGSIGVFATIIDHSEADKLSGIKTITAYPPESSYKNKSVREAVEGKLEYLIDESLTPFAHHFQNIIKANRPKLDETVEGILEGREFYAYDAEKNGLIDGIMNMQQAVELLHSLIDERKAVQKLFF